MGTEFPQPPVREQRQVSFIEAVKMGFEKYAQFGGRSSRSEYWWWCLFNIIIGCLCAWLSYSGSFGNWISRLITLGLFIPSLMLACRRLHDIGKGAGWYFIILLPIVGAIILLIWFCKPSQPGDNRFGPEPNVN